MNDTVAAPPAVEKPTRVRYGVLAFACSLSMITYLDRVCFGSVVGFIQKDFHLDDRQKGWLFFAFGVAYAAFEIPSGWLGDMFGARKTLIRIVLWWSIFTALTGALFPNPEWPLLIFSMLFLIRFFFGMGEAGAYPNIARAFHSWFPFEQRGFAKGAVWMAGRFAGGVTPLIVFALLYEKPAIEGVEPVPAPVLAASTVGLADSPHGEGALLTASTNVTLGTEKVTHWRHLFWIFGCLGIIWCVLFAYWYRDRPEDMPGVNQAEIALIHGRPIAAAVDPTAIRAGPPNPPDDHKPVAKVPWGKLFTNRNLWILCIMYFLGAYGWYFNITYLPNYLRDYHGVTYKEKWTWDFWRTSLMTGMPLLLGSVSCLLGGILSDMFIRSTGNRKWGRRLFGVVGKGLCAVCFFCCIFTDSAWGIVWAVSLAAFFNDLTMGAAWASCLDIGGKYSGIVAGCMNSVGNLGGALAGIITGEILGLYAGGLKPVDPGYIDASRPGWTCNFMIFGGVYVLAMLLWFFFDSTKQVAQE